MASAAAPTTRRFPGLHLELPPIPPPPLDGYLEERSVRPLSPHGPHGRNTIITDIYNLSMRVNQVIGRLQAFQSEFGRDFPSLLNRVSQSIENGDDRIFREFSSNFGEIRGTIADLASMIQRVTEATGEDYSGMLAYTEESYRATRPDQMRNDILVAHHIAGIDRDANALFAQEGSPEERLGHLQQLQELFQNIQRELASGTLSLSAEQYAMLNGRRDSIIAGVAQMQRRGLVPALELPPGAHILAPIEVAAVGGRGLVPPVPPIHLTPLDNLSYLYRHFTENVWNQLNLAGESSEARVAVLEGIAEGIGLTGDEFGRVYFFVWQIANDLFEAGHGPKPEGNNFGKDHACDDANRLREAIRRAAAELQEAGAYAAARV